MRAGHGWPSGCVSGWGSPPRWARPQWASAWWRSAPAGYGRVSRQVDAAHHVALASSVRGRQVRGPSLPRSLAPIAILIFDCARARALGARPSWTSKARRRFALPCGSCWMGYPTTSATFCSRNCTAGRALNSARIHHNFLIAAYDLLAMGHRDFQPQIFKIFSRSDGFDHKFATKLDGCDGSISYQQPET